MHVFYRSFTYEWVSEKDREASDVLQVAIYIFFATMVWNFIKMCKKTLFLISKKF